MVAAHLTVTILCAFALARAPADFSEWFADLDGLQVVPPNESPGTATVDLSYSVDEWVDPMSCYFQVTYGGLTGAATGAYLRWGRVGENGPLAQEILAGPFESPAFGEVDVPLEVLWGLYDDSLYVVITTTTYPEGEVRGVFQDITPPAVQESSWGRIRVLLR